MKQIFKKAAALVCAASLTLSGAVIVAADSEIDETVKTQLVSMAQGLTETIIPLSEEDIAQYKESSDAFTVQAMSAWETSKEEVGEFIETKAGDIEVDFDDDQYTVTVPVDFETTDANFVFVFGEDGAPASMNVDVQYPMSVTLQRAAMNTVMGIGTVFVMLVFLSFIISLFKFVPGLVEGKKKQEAAPAPAVPAPAPAPVPVVEETTDDTELIAVIAAAIAAAEGTTTDGFVVRSIRKVNRKKW